MPEAEWQTWLTDELRKGGMTHAMTVPGIARRLFGKVDLLQAVAFAEGYKQGYENGTDDGREEVWEFCGENH